MRILKIGKPFDPGRRFHAPRQQYNYDRSGHELLMFVDKLQTIEIESVRAGRADFALSVWGKGDLIFFHYKFRPAFEWGDCPFSWYMVRPENRKKPPLDIPKNEGAVLKIILADSPSGVVRAMRVCSMSHRFTIKLHKAIIEQSQRPFDQGDYDALLTHLYASNTSQQLVKRAVAKFTAGVVEPGERSDD